MTITVSWDNDDKTVILVRYQQPWTVTEFEASQIESQRLLSSVAHSVNVILDASKGGTPPANALGQFRESAKNRLPNQGLLIIVGANSFMKTLVDALQKVTRSTALSDIKFATSVEEARSLIRKKV